MDSTRAEDVKVHAMVERHVAQTRSRMVKAIRALHLSDFDMVQWRTPIAQLLIENALSVTVELTQLNLTDMRPWEAMSRPPDTPPGRVNDLLDNEKLWLREHPNTWLVYGNAVLEQIFGHRWLSSISATRERGIGYLAPHQRTQAQVVAATVRALAAKGHGPTSLLDPACGVGTLLAAAAGAIRLESPIIAGIDLDPTRLALAQRVLAIGGRASTMHEGEFSFTDPSLDVTFDLVVTDDSFWDSTKRAREAMPTRTTMRTANQAPRDDENRIPNRTDPAWTKLDLAWEKVTPVDSGGGTLVAFLRGGNLEKSRSRLEENVREWIHDKDLVKAVIALPGAGKFRDTYALVLSTALGKNFVGQTQVIDLRSSFDSNSRDSIRRYLSVSGVEILGKALTAPKPLQQVRTRQQKDFELARFDYRAKGVTYGIGGDPMVMTAKFSVSRARDASGWEWPLEGAHVKDKISKDGETPILDWRVDRFMDREDSKLAREQLALMGWSSVPLLTLAQHFEVHEQRSYDDATGHRPLATRWTDDVEVLTVSMSNRGEVSFGEVGAIRPLGITVQVELLPGIDGRFLAAWLRTEAGAEVLDVAERHVFLRDTTRHSLLRGGRDYVCFLAHLVVPIPDNEELEDLLDVHDLIESRKKSLADIEAQLWKDPRQKKELASAVRSYGNSDDLASWAESLPNPMATSHQTFLALQHDPEKQSNQLTHLWEASATFIGNYLLSALKASDDLWQQEIPSLRAALDNTSLSFERASFGTWNVTIERLAKLFRKDTGSEDPDTRQRAQELLGFPPRSVRDRVLDPSLSICFSKLASARNLKFGHGGPTNKAQAIAKLRHYQELTEELKAAVGFGWKDFPLVRPLPQTTSIIDGRFEVTAEKMVGPTTPFTSEVYDLEKGLENGGLYLLGVEGWVRLLPFVNFGYAINDRESTAFFYNQRTTEGVRMITHQIADENERTEPNGEIEGLLDDIASREPTPDFR